MLDAFAIATATPVILIAAATFLHPLSMPALEAVDYRAEDAERRFVESLRETGFGVLRNHPLDEARVTAIYAQWREFFQGETKESFLFDPERFDGFFPAREAEIAKGHAARDLKEYFHYYPWGRCPDELRTALHDYYESTASFAAELLAWVERQTPAEVSARFSEPLSQMIRGSEQSLLRVLHYPPINEPVEAGAVRAAAHEDINLLTILPSSNEPGLQAKTRSGEWINVPCNFGNLIVNVGDMLQEASGGWYPSTTHRVVNPEASAADPEAAARGRISLPLFLHPRPDVVLSERYTAASYLDERLRELRGECA